MPGNDIERRSFHYFRTRTALHLAGYFSSDFWDLSVSLSSHYHPIIRHAVVALGSIHERFENDDSSILSSNYDTHQGGFALQQYTYAISELTKSIARKEQQTIDTILIACILFACFEVCTTTRLICSAPFLFRSRGLRHFEVTMGQLFLMFTVV